MKRASAKEKPLPPLPTAKLLEGQGYSVVINEYGAIVKVFKKDK